MRICIFGGGTFSHVRNHLALAAPAFGSTARQLHEMIPGSELILTKMADPTSHLVTNQDVMNCVDEVCRDPNLKAIIFNVALCDFDGQVDDVPSGSHANRLKTREGSQKMTLTPAEKVISRIKKARPDVIVVGFKTTTNATLDEQSVAAENLLRSNNLDWVLANDTVTRVNFIVGAGSQLVYSNEQRKYALGNLARFVHTRVRNVAPTAKVGNTVCMNEASRVFGNAIVEGNVLLDDSTVDYHAIVKGDVELVASRVSGNVFITSDRVLHTTTIKESILQGDVTISSGNMKHLQWWRNVP